MTDTYKYDTYGERLSHEGTSTQPFQYNGRDGVQTDTNGLYQMRARYYNPEIKRFVNRDVLSGSIDDGLTMNRYAYVNGNPVSYIDPFGLSADGATWWQTGLSFAADATPFVGTIKGIQEVFGGVDLITGQRLSITDRVATGVGTVASVIPFGKVLGKQLAKEGIEGGAWLARKLGKESDSLASRLAKGCNCFTAGTQVKTDQGDKNIEDIQVGDKVLSQDDVTGEEGYKTVTATFNHMADEIYTIHVGDQEIESTYNHPFWVEGKGWTYVKDLKVGDWLEQADGTKRKIEQIEHEQRQARVYNMTVDEFHTYFVSDLGIWVHNTNDEACGVIGLMKQSDYADPYGGYYQRKEFRSAIYNAIYTEHNYKHLKARTINEAEKFSNTGRKHAQYLPEVNNKTLEKAALQKGLIVEGEKGSIYFLYDAGKIIGYDLGSPANWIRAELTSGGVYHGHPIAGQRLNDYLNKARSRQ